MNSLISSSSRGQQIFDNTKSTIPSLTQTTFALGIIGKPRAARRDCAGYLAVNGETEEIRLYGLALYTELSTQWCPVSVIVGVTIGVTIGVVTGIIIKRYD